MVVGDQRQGTSTLVRATVEDDRAGLGDGDRAAGDDGVDAVELGARQRRRVRDALHAVGDEPGTGDAGRDDDPARTELGEDRRHRGRDPRA